MAASRLDSNVTTGVRERSSDCNKLKGKLCCNRA